MQMPNNKPNFPINHVENLLRKHMSLSFPESAKASDFSLFSKQNAH